MPTPPRLDLVYHAKREAQERARAETATEPATRKLHLELAHRHAALLGKPEDPAPGTRG